MNDILAELKRLNAERTQGKWVMMDYATDFDDRQFYDWFINAMTGNPSNGEIRICSHESTNHRNGDFIAAMSNHATALIEIAEAARAFEADIDMFVPAIAKNEKLAALANRGNALKAALAALEAK